MSTNTHALPLNVRLPPPPSPPPGNPPTQTRHDSVQRMLNASPDEMHRVCAVYPNLLARDPGALSANMHSLMQLLRIDKPKAQELLRREPGLLSFNMSTLATRWSYAMQVGSGCVCVGGGWKCWL